MRIANLTEAEEFLSTENLDAFIDEAAMGSNSMVRTYLIPKDAGKKTALARCIANLVLEEGSVVLWVRSWGVFPSAENWELFDGYRRGHSELRSLSAAPVHLFEPGENAELASVLGMVLYFFWDADLVDRKGSLAIRMSHDEWMETRVEEPSRRARFSEYVALPSA